MKNKVYFNKATFFKSILQLVIGVLIILLFLSYFKKEISNLDYDKIINLIRAIGAINFFIIIILGVLGMALLSFYDFFVLRSIGMSKVISKIRVFKISFMTNSLNMILGFGGVIGAGLRYYLYKPYSPDNKKLVTAIGMILVSMLSGISMLSLLVLTNFIPGLYLYDNNSFFYLLLLMSLFLPIYLTINMRNPKIKTDRFLAIKLALVSVFEWVYAALLVLIVLYVFTGSYIFGKELIIVGVIVLASVVGLLSLIPGGVGTFDIFVLIGLSKLGFDNEIVAATILVYRLSYYVVPFLLGTLLLISEIILKLKVKFYKKKEGIL